MKSFYLFILVLVASVSCTSNYPLKSVDYNELFTSGNSKVWVIDKMLVNDINVAQKPLQNKEVLIFHESGVVDYIALKALGEKSPEKGRYYLDSDKRTLSVSFEEKKWFFKLPVLEEDKIILEPQKKGSAPFKAVLVPLPEL